MTISTMLEICHLKVEMLTINFIDQNQCFQNQTEIGVESIDLQIDTNQLNQAKKVESIFFIFKNF